MAQWVEVFANKPGDQSSIPKTHIGGRRDLSPLSCLPTCSVHTCAQISKDVLEESIQQKQMSYGREEAGQRTGSSFLYLTVPQNQHFSNSFIISRGLAWVWGFCFVSFETWVSNLTLASFELTEIHLLLAP